MAFAHYEAHTPIEESAREATSNRSLTFLLLLLLGLLFGWYRYNEWTSNQASSIGTTAVTAAPVVDEGNAVAKRDTATSIATAPRDTTVRATPRSSAPVPIAGNPLPEYPISALRNGEGGQVVLQVRIDEKGLPIDVDVARRSGSRELDHAATQAVREWRFKPATRNGKPVPSVVELPVAFKPQG